MRTVPPMIPEKAMPLPDLNGMHPLAIVAFGISLAIIFVATRSGYLNGKASSPAASASTAQVAAVIVDPTALNRASSSVDSLTSTLVRLIEVAEDMQRSQAHMATELDRIREEMRIQREIFRRSNS